MNKDLIRAYFRAYRARITDLEQEVEQISYSLDEMYSISASVERRLKNQISCLEDDARQEKYERWNLEDRIQKLERG